MINFFITLALLGILIFVHEFGHFIVAKMKKIKVERFCLGFGPTIISYTYGDTNYGINAVPLGGYVKLAGEEAGEATGSPGEFLSRSVVDRAAVIFSGPLFNYVFAFILFACLVVFTGEQRLSTTIGGVLDEYPAVAAGLQEGDIILSVDGKDVTYWEDVTGAIRARGAQEIAFLVRRGMDEKTYLIQPKPYETTTVFGKKHTVGLIGITPSKQLLVIRHPFFTSLYVAGKMLIMYTLMTVRFLGSLLTGAVRMKDSMVGMLGIFHMTSEVVKFGFAHLVNWAALLSMSLAIFNLLPIPVLDGGHLFFLALEAVRKKPIPLKAQEVVTQIGLWILIVFVLVVSYNDFSRFYLDKIVQLLPGK